MADIKLTCDEAPLDWPKNVALEDLTTCTKCSLRLFSPQPGSLQISTRRDLSGCSLSARNQFSLSKTAGAGDGVNIMEHEQLVSAEYRGQKYNLEEVIFHNPGIHIFPNRGDIAYPAELHIHMVTIPNVKPVRYITIVVPVSNVIDGPGQEYFKAMSVNPDPAAVRPVLSSILVPGAPILQYRGPDVRGRTKNTPTPDYCTTLQESEFLLVLGVAHIRDTDLERIPREGSCSTDKRFMPAEPVPHEKRTTILRDRLVRIASLASPGIVGLGPAAVTTGSESSSTELTCKPVKVVEGKDVIDICGSYVDILTLLGITGGLGAKAPDNSEDDMAKIGKMIFLGVGIFAGLLIADSLFSLAWQGYFINNKRASTWEPLTIIMYLLISGLGARFLGAALGL